MRRYPRMTWFVVSLVVAGLGAIFTYVPDIFTYVARFPEGWHWLIYYGLPHFIPRLLFAGGLLSAIIAFFAGILWLDEREKESLMQHAPQSAPWEEEIY